MLIIDKSGKATTSHSFQKRNANVNESRRNVFCPLNFFRVKSILKSLFQLIIFYLINNIFAAQVIKIFNFEDYIFMHDNEVIN